MQFGRNSINKVHLIREFLEQEKPRRVYCISLVGKGIGYDSCGESGRLVNGKPEVSIVREVGNDLKKKVFI